MADIPFEMEFETWETYCDLLQDAQAAEASGDAIRLQELISQLKSLPNYPHHAHPTEDRIVPVPKQRAVTVMPRRRFSLT